MLTPLQRRVAEIVADVAQNSQFALAGGAALIARGDIDRKTRDLDFFTPDSSEIASVVPQIETALRNAGLEVSRGLESPAFVRFEVRDGGDLTEVDFGTDARLLPVELSPLGPTIAGEELAVDKILALFGRAEPRDFIDLAAVADRYGFKNLAARAIEKDAGFDPQVLNSMLAKFDRLLRQEFEIPDAAYQRLDRTVERWKELTRGLSRDELEHHIGPDRGDDTGLGL